MQRALYELLSKFKFKFSQFLYRTHTLYELTTALQTDNFSANITYLIKSTVQNGSLPSCHWKNNSLHTSFLNTVKITQRKTSTQNTVFKIAQYKITFRLLKELHHKEKGNDVSVAIVVCPRCVSQNGLMQPSWEKAN